MNTQNTPTIFNYGDNVVRSVTINENPWFVAKDVCQTLGLTDVSQALNGNENKGTIGLDDDEKLMHRIYVSGQMRQMWCVNESGMYALIFRSNKPEAKAFRKWVTSEVLPAIRREGKYDPLAQRMEQLKEERHQHYLAIDRHRAAIRKVADEIKLIDSKMDHTCQECGKVCKNAQALGGHYAAVHIGTMHNFNNIKTSMGVE
jgi:prophage antirepressor-like protein